MAINNTNPTPEVTLEEKKTSKWSLTKFDITLLVGIIGMMIYTLFTAGNLTAVTELWGFFKRSCIMACIGFITTGFVIPALLKFIGDKKGTMLSDYVDNVRRPANGIIFVVWLCVLVLYSFVIWEPNVTLTQNHFSPAVINKSYIPLTKSDVIKRNKSSVNSYKVIHASATEENTAAMVDAMELFKNVSLDVRSVTK